MFVTSTEMSADNRIMLVSNYLKRNYVKEHNLRFTNLRFMLDTTPNFFAIETALFQSW